ncbi:PDZ domain-containing protein [Mycolicibacterium sp. 018/SC-01/001]|uniref:S1C family serine protease n=1 Tax=Mycolicibacterium sp. 018/SC-01/001 TaxID=2592069 RepID=UPI0011805904|nr:trypsin-like peptidase domain-containing protein [Mycolicibacterium sp. 018/SC-01/001]TRW80320.1 PDZ domain-containing protein [Mycolicibacterium sp. 018/SC-01/001]
MATPPPPPPHNHDWSRVNWPAPPNPLPHNPTPWPNQAPPHGGPRPSRRDRRSRTPRALVAAGAAAVAIAGGGIGAAAAVAVTDHQQTVATPPAAVRTQPVKPAADAAPGSVEAVAAKVMPSVVKIQIAAGQGVAEGSGIVLSPDGLILTNNHVVAPLANGAGGGTGAQPAAFDGGDASATVTFSDGRSVPFTVVGTDPTGDLAVVHAEGVSGLTPITFGSSKDVKIGQEVVAIGSPLGLQGTVTKGIVSALNRPVAAGDGEGSSPVVLDALQTDAAINPGNSGGPLVDMNGDLIGVNSAGASMGSGSGGGSIGLGFAIPSDQAKRIADELVSSGTATHGSLGVQLGMQNDTANDAANAADVDGAVVAQVAPGSPAAQAGLSDGSVITKINDQVIDGPEALAAAVRSKAPGDQVSITYRDASGALRTAQVALGTA